MGSRVVGRNVFALVGLVGLIVVQSGTSLAVQRSEEPSTADQIVAAIGSEADARAVMTTFLRETFPPSDRARTEFVLRTQMRDEWLPKSAGVEIVQLSDSEAAARLKTCGTYIVISVLKQSNRVSVSRRPKCTASVHVTEFAIREGQWRAVGSGIGSGWIGPAPADCPRCVAQ